ncbi:cation-transporting ATPase CA1, partial [Haematococcus lacustris]
MYAGIGMTLQDAFARDYREVAAYYNVDVSQGLSEAEAAQARNKYGRNELEPEQSTPLWKLILKQFDDLLVKILMAAAAVDFVIAMTEGDSILSGLVEPMVIMLILVANGALGM